MPVGLMGSESRYFVSVATLRERLFVRQGESDEARIGCVDPGFVRSAAASAS